MLAESKTGSIDLISLLCKRSDMLAKTRAFFAQRGLIEVDTPLLSSAAPIDLHIDVMKVDVGGGAVGFLHTSPEYAMKKLLAQGAPDLYQLSHVFRAGEIGPKHLPEFTLIEWYRKALPFDCFIEETLEFIQLFLGPLPTEILSYRQALFLHTNLDYVTSPEELYKKGTLFSPDAACWDYDDLLSLLFTHLVEPHLGQGKLTVITDYPGSQAALAKKKRVDGVEVARRFEIYYQSVELANGYDELCESEEQKERLILANHQRALAGKESLPIDTEFLEALAQGLPDCRGVAVGFDRLCMLQEGLSTLPQWPLFFASKTPQNLF